MIEYLNLSAKRSEVLKDLHLKPFEEIAGTLEDFGKKENIILLKISVEKRIILPNKESLLKEIASHKDKGIAILRSDDRYHVRSLKKGEI